MIHFSEIANPPTPVYRPMCVACDGRGVVPSLSRKSVQRCEQCSGTGKEAVTAGAELKDADGNVMTAEAAQAFVATLP